MPKKPQSYLEIHRAADRIERRVARAVYLTGDRLASRVPVAALADAIDSGDQAAITRLVESINVEDAYQPAARIVEDTVIKGAKLAVDDINEELNRG